MRHGNENCHDQDQAHSGGVVNSRQVRNKWWKPMMFPQMTENGSVLADLFNRWDARLDRYGDVLCGSAFVREGDTWRNVITFFVPQKRGTGCVTFTVFKRFPDLVKMLEGPPIGHFSKTI
jgi:hypothetical protein